MSLTEVHKSKIKSKYKWQIMDNISKFGKFDLQGNFETNKYFWKNEAVFMWVKGMEK